MTIVNMISSALRRGLLLASLLMTSGVAHAAYTCTVGATSVNFGNYSALNSVTVDSSGTVTVTCTWINGNQTFSVLAAIGTGGSGTFTPRSMANGANTLNYNIYLDSTHTQIWGDGSGGSQTNTTASCTLRKPTPTCTHTLTAYGRIPSGQNVAAGLYADSLIVTITF